MGTITKENEIAVISSVGDWSIEEKTQTNIFEDGELISTSNSRKCYNPCSQELTTEGIDSRVIALARTMNWHTDAVKKAYIENINKDLSDWDKTAADAYDGIEFGLTS